MVLRGTKERHILESQEVNEKGNMAGNWRKEKKKRNKEEIRNEKGMETNIFKWRSMYILPLLSSEMS